MIRTCLRLAAAAALAAGAGAAFSQPTPAGSAPGASGNTLNPMAPPGGMSDSAGGSGGSMLDQVERARREARGDRVRGGSSSARRADRARPATAAEVIAGAEVKDSAGVLIGTIESVNAEGAVVLYGTSRARIPLEAFGHNAGGLLIGMTRAEFEQAVSGAAATPS